MELGRVGVGNRIGVVGSMSLGSGLEGRLLWSRADLLVRIWDSYLGKGLGKGHAELWQVGEVRFVVRA